MHAFSILSAAVLNSLLRQGATHPLCYYDDRPTDPDEVLTFCPAQEDGACCDDLEEIAAINVYEAAFPDGTTPSEECADYYRQVACGPCNSFSAHLYEVLGSELGPEDGMTMTYDFCQELIEACEGEIDFPTYDGESYCEKHTLGSTGPSTDAYWSYPLPDIEFPPSGLVDAFSDLPDDDLPSDLICMHMTPDGDEWWLGGQDGQIVQIPAEGATSSTLVLDLSSGADLYVAYEEGLLDFAFSPAFNNNYYFYVSYTVTDEEGAKNRLSRFTHSSMETATFASIDIVLTSEVKATSIHSAGWVGFKPSDYASRSDSYHDIYWAVGDGGPQTDPLGTGQDTTNILASIVRVSVPSGTDDSDVGYTIPSGNYPGGRGEICAPGFRNPFRCGFDKATDDLYCGDVGHTMVEEVDIIKCGENYGWGRFEGSRCQEAVEDLYGDCDGASRSEFTFPIYEFCHSDYYSSDPEEAEFTDGIDICGTRGVTGFAVIGGMVYHGQKFSDVLGGAYLFADVQKKNIYYLTQVYGEWTPGVIIGDSSAGIISFSEDINGEIFVITENERKPYQLPCGDLCSTTCLEQSEVVPTYASLGCFGDDMNDRALELQKSPNCGDGEDAMSPAICASYCETIEGAVYFGVQFAYECFCGAEGEDYAKHGSLDDFSCNYLCVGNTNEFCGGLDAIEVYEFESSPTPSFSPVPVPPTPLSPTPFPAFAEPTPFPASAIEPTPSPVTTGYTYLGCYGDSRQSRTLSGPKISSPSMTSNLCATFCKGSQYFGTQYSNECFCSAAGETYYEYGEATCEYSCSGDASQICGGSFALSIYECDGFTPAPTSPIPPTPAPAAPTAPIPVLAAQSAPTLINAVPTPSTPVPAEAPATSTYTTMGCYTDSREARVLSGALLSTTLMATELCESFCMGYTYFGTEFGKECFCGSPASLGSNSATNCDMVCAGDSSQICGGFDAITIYEYTGVTNSDFTYMGCFTDSKSNRVMGSKTINSSMTTELCASICGSSLYFGTEYGSECFCGDGDDYDALGTSVACTIPCAGDSTEICGGYNAIRVYMK